MNSREIPIILLAFANERLETARYLRNLPAELGGIREALIPLEDQGLIELVILPNATVKSIMDTFQRPTYRNRIAIFHYGGHGDETGLQLEDSTGNVAWADGEGLAAFLSKQEALQLVFLNACSTESQIKALVLKGLPMAIGTVKSIADEVAAKLAIRFYIGLAMDRDIERAWEEAIDERNIAGEPHALHRDRVGSNGSEGRTPWFSVVRPGSEHVKNWRIARHNPLTQLPAPSLEIDLPLEPYRYLQRYQEEDARIFFGRGSYIYDLYHQITTPKTSPIILLYGQSGVGKSSLLDAGLVPRLKRGHMVEYVRRDGNQSLLETVLTGLKSLMASEAWAKLKQQETLDTKKAQLVKLGAIQDSLETGSEPYISLQKTIAELQKEIDSLTYTIQETNAAVAVPNATDLVNLWRYVEEKADSPFILIVDQVEGIYTSGQGAAPAKAELYQFLEAIKPLFFLPKDRPRGKLLLSYRKEYHPEIQEGINAFRFPTESVFLQQLDRNGIFEVVNGLTSDPSLTTKYRLSIEEGLPSQIADDLLRDKDAAIAPVLQILLTEMWKEVEPNDHRIFSTHAYHRLARESEHLSAFIDSQLDKLEHQLPNVRQSGLALDVLGFHTRTIGSPTAAAQSIQDVKNRYYDFPEIGQVISQLNQLYLLTPHGPEENSLAHDTLAPIIQTKLQNSDLPGQRASRILENKIVEYQKDPDIYLDGSDLAIVEEGKSGMRGWTSAEFQLIEQSRKERDKRERFGLLLRRAAIAAFLVITGLLAFSIQRGYETEKARDREADATRIAEGRADSLDKVLKTNSKLTNSLQSSYDDLKLAQDSLNASNIKLQITSDSLAFVVIERNKIARQRLKDYQRAQALADSLQAADSVNVVLLALARKNEQKARKLYFEALSENVAARSLTIEGNDNIKGKMAYLSFLINRIHGGKTFNSEIYNALNQALQRDQFEGQAYNQLTGSNYMVGAVAFHPRDASWAYFITDKSEIHQTSIQTEDNTLQIQPTVAVYQEKVNQGFRGKTLKISPNGAWLVAGFEKYPNLNNPKRSSLTFFRVDPKDGSFVADASQGLIQTMSVTGVHFFNDRQMLSCGSDSWVRLWELTGDNWKMADSVLLQTTVRQFAVSPNHQELAIITSESKVKVYSLGLGKGQIKLGEPQILDEFRDVSALAYHPDIWHPWLVVGQDNGQLAIWDGNRSTDLIGHSKRITSIRISMGGQFLACASKDGQIYLWEINGKSPEDLSTASPIKLGASENNPWATVVEFAPEGNWLMAGYKQHPLEIWSTKVDVLAQRLQQIGEKGIFGPLTPTEWNLYVGKDVGFDEEYPWNTDGKIPIPSPGLDSAILYAEIKIDSTYQTSPQP